MARSRFWGLTLVSVALAITIIQTGWSDDPRTGKLPATLSPPRTPAQLTSAAPMEPTCQVYALGELGNDANLGKWIAGTIPEVIQPGTWTPAALSAGTTGKRFLSYYAPTKTLVVYHTPAVQAQVEAFLKNLKKALPQERAATRPARTAAQEQGVVPAIYATPSVVKTSDPTTAPKVSYPVPYPPQSPKHLFHFIIRYEGEGVVDSTVAGLLKEIYGGKNAASEDAGAKAKPAVAVPAVVAQ
jgi:hypothetical protein